MPNPSFDSDFLLAESCLQQDAVAVEKLRRILRGGVCRFLMRVGMERADALRLTSDLLHELLVERQGRKPLLQQFSGQCALGTWLVRVAVNRWCDLNRKAQRRGERDVPLGNHDVVVDEKPALRPDEEPLIALFRQAICEAMRGRPAEDFVVFQLLHAHGLHQSELARIFACSRRSIARQSERVAAEIRDAIMENLRALAPNLRLQWEDVVEICRAAATEVLTDEI